MTSSTRLMQQKLLINRLLAKKDRKGLAKGFTLIELMIVVAIIGILSAVALPQFLGVRDRSAVSAKIGEMIGLAKECSVGQVTSAAQPVNITGTGIGVTGATTATADGKTTFPCSGALGISLDYTFVANTTGPISVTAVPVGIKCLTSSSAEGNKKATITVATDGSLSCAWAA